MASDRVLCGECRHLKTDGPCDQWYYYCDLDGPGDRGNWYERAGNGRMRDKLDGSCEMGEVDRHHTECLRTALDEMGIRWKGTANWMGTRDTDFNVGPLSFSVTENNDGTLSFYTHASERMDADEVIGIVRAVLDEVSHE